MKKIGIIIKREYLRRVQKKSFIIITLLAPLLLAALVFVPLWLSTIKSDHVNEIVIADKTGKYAALFHDTDQYHFSGTDRDVSTDRAKENHPGVIAFLEITGDLLQNPKAVTLYSETQIPPDLKREVSRTLNQYLTKEKQASFNIPDLDKIIESSYVNLDINTIKWGKDGTVTRSSSELSSVIGLLFTMIIYMFIMMYGAMVMQGVIEEKTNRIVELMVSSVRPFDLMMGKILGIGLVGLTQVFMWCVLTFIFVSIGGLFLGMSLGGGVMELSQVAVAPTSNMPAIAGFLSKISSFNFIEIIACFVLFFIGGYVSYASLFAAIGAAIDNPEDSQQFIMPIMLILLFALYAGIYSINNTNGPLAFWGSLIPFTSPIVMMVRIPYDIPFWQIALSLALLFVSAIGFVWISAKIYRIGILMYGKKINFKELARWIKYS